jgi:ribonuclease Z
MMSARFPKFSTTILGSNSALPANGRHPTAQLLNANNHYYLIDCGEGTQIQLRRFGLKMQRIEVVFISHMHGDHYFGLVGLLNSMHLLGRTRPLKIIAPKELEDIVRIQLDAAGGRIQYPIEFVKLDIKRGERVRIHEDEQIQVDAFLLKHRIPCHGFIFTEQERDRSYLPEKGGPDGVMLQEIPRLKAGEDVVREDGTVFRAEDYTQLPEAPRSYAYCTDTLPLDSTISLAGGVNCMYHEATFLEAEKKRAKETFHSTAKQAAEIAQRAAVNTLLIGHYSARYTELDEHLVEARAIFPRTYLTKEGGEFEIK